MKTCGHPYYDTCKDCGEYACTECAAGHGGTCNKISVKLGNLTTDQIKAKTRNGDMWALAKRLTKTDHTK